MKAQTKPETVVVYTDGAVSGNPGPGAWAYLLNDEMVVGTVNKTTNNRMELMAIYWAVKVCPMNVRLFIVTDSRIAYGMTVLRWKGANPVLQAIGKAINRMADAKGVRLRGMVVKGHAGHPQNEMVDEAARMAVRQLRAARQAASG